MATIHSADASQADYFPTVPTLSIDVNGPGIHPSTEQSYTLVCIISGADKLNATMFYRWMKGDGVHVAARTSSKTLYFGSVSLSDAGQYSCQVSVVSNYIETNVTLMDTYAMVIESEPDD